MRIFLGLVIGAALGLMSSRSIATQTVVVGDDKLKVTLSLDENGLTEREFNMAGQYVEGLRCVPWILDTDKGMLSPSKGVSVQTPTDKTTNKATFKGKSDVADWILDYEVTGLGRITKTLTLTPKTDLLLKKVSLWNGHSDIVPVVSSTSLQDIAAFYRQLDQGMFVSLDFPYSKIVNENQTTTVSYPPYDKLKAGKPYACHSLTFGATNLKGQLRYGFDEGEVEAMDSYVQERFKPRFNRPMFVGACIINRYTQVTGDSVFYTMKDHPTLSFNHDILKRDIELQQKLGIEYYQLWTGPFDSVPGDPDPKFVDQIVKFARKHDVRIGDYSGTNSLFCLHYNEHRNSLENHPEWGITWGDVCFGNPKFIKFYKDMVVNNDKRYDFKIHCLDFLNIHPCDATDHQHPAGQDSIYAQVRGLVEILEGLNGVSPEMMTWSNSGNWMEFLPKIAWSNSNLYLTDPYIAEPWQGLNMTRLLDDVRREQMVSLHYSRFIPYRFFTNCQYFFSQNSIVPDIRNYPYGALSSVAVTPNLCLAEIRPWLDKMPTGQQNEVMSFYKKWTGFLKRNFDLWKKTYQVGENPGMGSVEIYGHAKGDHGFVFLVNPQFWGRSVVVPLDASLGFSGKGPCEIAELHPVERLLLTGNGPFANLGSKVVVHVPAQTVMVLEVKPAPKTITEPRLYGVTGSVSMTKTGYLVKTSGAQGTTEKCVVLLPDKSLPVLSAAVRDVPKQPLRQWSPTPVKLVASNPERVMLDVTFRRDKAPDELRQWTVKSGNLSDGVIAGLPNGFKDGTRYRFPLFDTMEFNLPLKDADADRLGLGSIANFCGAYVDNAFSENQETWIDLKTRGKDDKPVASGLSFVEALLTYRTPEVAKDQAKGWWVQTDFHLPFMYMIGAEPSFDEHTILVLPFVRQSRITQIKAWINGVPLDVQKYLYPRNRALSCFYADLVGSGARGGGRNSLVVYFETK